MQQIPVNGQISQQEAAMSLWTHYLKDVGNLIDQRLKAFFGKGSVSLPEGIPTLPGFHSSFQVFLHTHQLSIEEYLILVLAAAPHISPQFLEAHIREALPEEGDFPQLGGVRGKVFRGFLPTVETAMFLLAGKNMIHRQRIKSFFHPDHLFAKKHILTVEEVPEGEPQSCGKLLLSQDYLDLFLLGKMNPPAFGLRFPAQRIETQQSWEDLVLPRATLKQVQNLELWVRHGHTLFSEWDMRGHIKPGYRVLFHGPPGTGKTMTAKLLGKYTGKEVYKVDLSMVVSKFIGETEKNLSRLLAKAEDKDWILFFDEADALFGKRTGVKDAHDKYANQEVSYLLQRIELYQGMVILASNLKDNIDEAFIRRFQAIIHFPIPRQPERLRLWQQAFPSQISWAADISFQEIAQRFEMTGAEIINVVQYCCLHALDRNDFTLKKEDLIEGIEKEFAKNGRILR
ncbi:MAG: ATP-binding protein [Bacteroidota bacterium]